MATDKKIIELDSVWKSFKSHDRQDLLVLDKISFAIQQGETIAILGKTGAGKSTLLRIIAGLEKPSGGRVLYKDSTVRSPISGLSMVFQNFALIPWLTVLQNVEIGLSALGVSYGSRRKQALHAIDTIGLDGFESAFPKELSGGMQQRVGFARALVVNPDVLLMDEPFSQLDVLTAENLRTDLLDLWEDKQTNIKSMLIVTHSIEEAVLMADRILIFKSDPGSIQEDMKIDIPHPRHQHENKIKEYVDRVYQLMTQHTISGRLQTSAHKAINLGYRIPDVDISEITGLIEEIADPETSESNNLQVLAENLHLDIDELFPLVEIVDILHFAIVDDNSIKLTTKGREYAEADIQLKKEIFSHHLLNFIPIARHIRRILDDRPGHRAKSARFLSELEDYLSESEAERVLTTIINWGRYAEVLAYDVNTEELSLENPK